MAREHLMIPSPEYLRKLNFLLTYCPGWSWDGIFEVHVLLSGDFRI